MLRYRPIGILNVGIKRTGYQTGQLDVVKTIQTRKPS